MQDEKKEVLCNEPQPTFTKEKIIQSKKYSRYVDYLSGNLKDGESYTFEQIENILRKMGD